MKNYLDENLKKLIGGTEPMEALSADIKSEIVGNLLRNTNMETAQANIYLLRDRFSIINFKSAAIAAIIIIFFSLFLLNKPKDNISKHIETVKTKLQNTVEPQVEQQKFAAFDIDKIAAAGDVNGLIAALSNDNQDIKTAAANYLAKLGNMKAVEPLKKQEAAWHGSPAENPFTKVITEIENKQKENKPADANKTSGSIKKVNDPNDPNGWPYMEVYITDKQNDEPIKGARVKGSESNIKSLTDSNGHCKITLGKKKPDYFSVYVEKEGYVPMYFNWGKEDGRTIPKEFEFFLERGTVIGGIVVNEQNEPVQKASVIISHYPQEANRDQPFHRINDYELKTDSNGKWQCDIIPADISYENQVSIKIKHPDYAEYQIWAQSQESTIQKLRDKTFTSILKKGSIIHGYVLDSENRPISDADVFIGEDRYGSENLKTKTDSSGYYEFIRVKQGFNLVTAIAKGYAPDMKEFELHETEKQHNFTLLPGNTIRGRVVDVNGNPIAKAGLCADRWRSYRMINWNCETDADGRFAWTDAPADEVQFDFYAKNYMSLRHNPLTAKDEEYEIVLHPPLIISGTVKSAETNEPVKEFTITQGLMFSANDNRIHWERKDQVPQSVKSFTDGKYVFKITERYFKHLLKVETKDGKIAISRSFDSNENNVKYDFVVGKEEDNRITGTVYAPDGKNAQGATVYLIIKNQWITLENGKNRYQQDLEKSITDSQGKFSLPDHNNLFKLLAVSDEGFADVNSSEFLSDPVIHLVKWGRIEGVVYIGSKIGADCTIRTSCQQKCNNPDNLNYSCSAIATTDSQGKFLMDKVVPGENYIYRTLQSDNAEQGTSTAMEKVEVISGQTLEVVLGGTGRAIIGKIIWPEDELFKKSLWINTDIQVQQNDISYSAMMEKIYSKVGDMPRPENFETLTAKQCFEWYKNWAQSDEGKAYQSKITEEIQKQQPQLLRQNVREGGIIVNADGSFRGEDIEEGSYTIRLIICEKKGKFGNPDLENQIIGNVDFTMPPVDQSNIDTPLDLGQLQMQIIRGHKTIQPGSNAPDFTIETNAGSVKLSDLRGKYTILVFWNAWLTLNDPDLENTMLEIFETYKKYSGNSNFEFIGISGKSMPMQKDVSEKYLNENSCKWKQAYVRYDNPISKAYQYQPNISVILIGPDGKIIESGIDGKRLDELLGSVNQ
jgi:peroxiredoxin